MSLKMKLVALTGMSLALVVTAACKGGAEKASKEAQKACNMAQRVCKDGRAAKQEGGNSCYQSCPEDTSTTTATSTVTSTATVTKSSTVTTTQTATLRADCSMQQRICPDGSNARAPVDGSCNQTCPGDTATPIRTATSTSTGWGVADPVVR
jgi:hypothetical protein